MVKDTFASTVIGKATTESQITLVEDAHDEPERRQGMFHSLEAMARSGVKHVFMESPAFLQPALNRLQDGKIDFETYSAAAKEEIGKQGFSRPEWDHEKAAQRKAELEHFLSEAKKLGIRIHYVDEPPEIARTHPHAKEYLALDVKLTERSAAVGEKAAWSEIKAELKERFGEDAVADFFQFNKTLSHQRFEENKMVAERIHQIAGSEKSVVFYGAAHMEPETCNFPAELGLGRLLNQLGHSTEIVDISSQGDWVQKETLPAPHALRSSIPQDVKQFANAIAETMKGRLSPSEHQGTEVGAEPSFHLAMNHLAKKPASQVAM